MDYRATPKTNSSKVNIRFLVNEALHKGTFIDRKVDGSNTLLHLAVEYDLSECVVKLLSSGASTSIKNADGLTPVDVALVNGNQILLQILGRREDYGKHLQMCGDSNAAVEVKQEKILTLTLGAVYEDYLDWTDTKRCLRLKELLESLKNDGATLNQTISHLCARKQKSVSKLEALHNKLRNKEHDLCLTVWEVVQQERSSRKSFEQITEDVSTLKGVVEKGRKKVYWSGEAQVQINVGLVLNRNMWLCMSLEVNGDSLVVVSSEGGLGDAEEDGSVSSSSKKTTGPIRRKLNQRNAEAASRSIPLDSIISVEIKRQLASTLSSKVPKSNQEYVVSELAISFCETAVSGEVPSGGAGSRSHSPMVHQKQSDRLEVLNLRIGDGAGGKEDNGIFSNSEEMLRLSRSVEELSRHVRVFSTIGGFEVAKEDFSLSHCLAQEMMNEEPVVHPPVDLLLPQNSPVARQVSDPQSDLTATPGGSSSSSVSPMPVPVSRESMSYASGLTSIDTLVNTVTVDHSLRASYSVGGVSGHSHLSSISIGYSSSHRHSLHDIPETSVLACYSESPPLPTNVRKSSNKESFSASPRSTRSPRSTERPSSELLFDGSMTTGRASKSGRRLRNSIDSADPKESLFELEVSASVPCRRASTSSTGNNEEWRRRSSLSLADHIRAIKNMNANDDSVENVAEVMQNVSKYNLATLKRLLYTLRSKRDCIHKNLEEVITRREKLLEKLHFLQALRAVVDSPPRAPTRNLSSTKSPSIEKAVQMLSVYRDHVDNVTDAQDQSADHCTSSSREKLCEAEDFVKIMLQDCNIMDEMAFAHDQPKHRSESTASVSVSLSASTRSRFSADENDRSEGSTADIVIPRFRHKQEELAYGSNSRELSVSFSQSVTNGSILMQASSVNRSTGSVSWQPQSSHAGMSFRSPVAEALYDAARSPLVNNGSAGASSFRSSLKQPDTPSFGGSGRSVSISLQQCESPRTPSKASASEHLSIRTSPWKMLSRKELKDSVLDSDAFGPSSAEDEELAALKEKSVDAALAKHTRKSSQSAADGPPPSFSLSGPPALVSSRTAPADFRSPAAAPVRSPPSTNRKQPFTIFGSPPPELQSDYDEVMRHLEEIWNCELESFEAVGRLAQCLVMREQTWQRLSRLKIQETAMVVPSQDDLYDIEL